MQKFRQFILAIFAVLSPGIASPLHTRSPYAVKDHHPVPSGWTILTRVPEGVVIHLQIGLKHGRFDELERHLEEVSDPRNKRYGQHLTAAQVAELAKPSQETDILVREWLADHGINQFTYSPVQDWVHIDLDVRLAEKLLETEYHIYQQEDGGTTVMRAQHWSLPLHLHQHIEAVHPTNAFYGAGKIAKDGISRRSEVPPTGLGEHGLPSYEELATIDRTNMGHMDVPDVKDVAADPTVDQACNSLATSPLCLRTLYGTLHYTVQAPEKVRVGLVNYLDQVNNHSDIEIFLKRFRPEAAGEAYKIKTEVVANGRNQQTPVTQEQLEAAGTTVGLEGNLNAQTVIGLAHPISVTAYNVGGRAPFQESMFTTENRNEPYLEWLQHVLAQPDLPQVITTSYADEEQSVPYWYAKRACQGFAMLGARGVSVLFASGDDGVGADGKCFSNDGRNKPMFLPTFPASCPYVTAVGGTRHWGPEMVGFDARTTFVAGGGFSNYFTSPAYQRDVVKAYVKSLGSLHDGLYNRTGRGYPDISVRSYHYVTVWNGTARIIDGTSASSPAAAAIFSLINDALAAKGKPALGWLNPWIYSEAYRGFTDVTVGSNAGCNTAGFPAKEGWDAATGFGTPWFPALKELAEQRQYRETRPWYMTFPPWDMS